MIIQIRGTSGSGKSTVMRHVMESLGDWNSVFSEGRKKPLYYVNVERPDTVVLGHYESPCGGGDTIGSSPKIYAEIVKRLEEGFEHVLVEGLLLSEDVKWSSQMSGLKVVFLITPLETCLEQIQKRRTAEGNDKPLNPSNTSNRVGVIERARTKLVELGVECRRCSANQAHRVILNWLGLPCKTNKRG